MINNLILTLGRREDYLTDEREARLLEQIDSLIERIPPPCDINEVKKNYPNDYRESLNTVLTQETINYCRLIEVITGSVMRLQSVMRGKAVYTKELGHLADQIARGDAVPKLWLQVCYPTLKPIGSFVADLIRRTTLMSQWVRNGHPNHFWMGLFFFPHAFRTALLQNHSRKHELDITQIELEHQIMNHQTITSSGPPGSVTVSGFILEGARWDSELNCMTEQEHHIIRCYLPDIRFVPAVKSRENPPKNSYKCPVFKTEFREDDANGIRNAFSRGFIMLLDLLSSEPPSHWTKRSVVAILETSE